MTAIPILNKGRRYAGSQEMITDIIQLKRTEEGQSEASSNAPSATHTLRRRNRELALLNQASQAFNSTLDLDQVLITVLEEVRRLLGVVASSIWLIDPQTNELARQQATGPQSEIVRGQRLAPREGPALPVLSAAEGPVPSKVEGSLVKGIAGWVARSGRSLIVPDTWADERHSRVALRSILSVPLWGKQNVIGVLQVMSTTVDRFSTADLALLEALAASAAIAIDNARLVKALHQCTRELEAQNEELDAFNCTVAHDLKNPLGLVIGFAEVLERDGTTMPDEELQYYLHAVAQNGRKMKCIIEALLLLARAHEMKVELEPLDMANIVAEALQQLALMIEEYQADIILPDTWPVALGYASWVEEVWANIISNAIKYGGRPPRVELGATVQADGAAPLTVHFWVRDNGPGISSQGQTRLFTPFTRLGQASAQGHGLGLSIVQRIVEKLGGEVGVESQVGRGSVFSFTLPGVQAEGRSASSGRGQSD